MRVNKPFKNNRDLLAILRSRGGLEVGDLVSAEVFLQSIGYHRLSGYRYPFRRLLPEDKQNHVLRQYRMEEHVYGPDLYHVVQLYYFDLKLRNIILEATLEFEVKLRASISSVLGARSPIAHIDS